MLMDKELVSRLTEREKEELKYRRSGRSTALALKYLAEAIQNPKVFIPVRDHYGTIEADKMLLLMIRGLVGLIGLEHIKFDSRNRIGQVGIYFDWQHPLQEKIS